MDPKVNGQLQKEWGWLVAAYLFLGGVGAGAFTIAAINLFASWSFGLSTKIGLWISWPAVLIGTIALLSDLGSPMRAFLAGMKPGSSWIARGTWIISLFMILAFVLCILLSFTDVSNTVGGSMAIAVLAAIGVVLAVMTMAYTGILLGAAKGIPFWRSGVVPVVFVVSAMVTGHFTIILGMILAAGGDIPLGQLQIMAAEAAGLVVLEVLAIIFFLQAAYKLPDSRESAERILRNRLFVIGYIVFGLGIPLVLMLVLYRAVAGSVLTPNLALAVIGSILGLAGGLILRWAVLVCGALPTLNIAGFQFRRIPRPKQQKPGIGMLPPQ